MEQDIESLRKAGQIAGKALIYGKNLIKPGSKLLEVTEKIEQFIKKEGGELAFPVNISCNETAAHYVAKKEDDFVFKDEIIKLDVGVHINGYIGDNACTIDLSGRYKDLVDASAEALKAAIKLVKPGVELGAIGEIIEKTILDKGFQPVRNLSGHGVDEYQTHCYPTIPNFDNEDGTELEEGMVIAIEPFATNGAGMIKEQGIAEIFAITDFKAMRVGFARDIIKYIQQKFKTLPFSKRDLLSKFSEAQINYTMKKLKELESIYEFAPLVERSGGMVSQTEHTLLVTKEGCEVLTQILKE